MAADCESFNARPQVSLVGKEKRRYLGAQDRWWMGHTCFEFLVRLDGVYLLPANVRIFSYVSEDVGLEEGRHLYSQYFSDLHLRSSNSSSPSRKNVKKVRDFDFWDV